MSSAMFVCDKKFSCCDHQYWDSLDQVEQEAKECGHLIEVAPVVHGRWIRWCDNEERFISTICSVCHTSDNANPKMHYCPNCGARMDGAE